MKDKLIYIAGFLDADGCINAQLVRRKDYIYGYQIRVWISFSQKSNRHWFIIWLHEIIKVGVIRKRNDGMSEYTITGIKNVRPFLLSILNYLVIKADQGKLLCEIMNELETINNHTEFYELCKKVDKFVLLKDSRNRTVTSDEVYKYLNNKFSP